MSFIPDCDIIKIDVKNKNNYIFISKNEIGILLFHFICKMKVNNGKFHYNKKTRLLYLLQKY